jgi:hypothetical protein
MGRASKILGKIASGEFKELADRAREEWRRKEERTIYEHQGSIFRETEYPQVFSPGFLKRFGTDEGNVDFCMALRSHDSAIIFPGFAKAVAFGDYVDRVCPDERARILHCADQILANRFPIFNLGFVSYSDPPLWNSDPIQQIQAPGIFYADIDYLNPAVVGDAKVVWELSRLQFVYDLGQAYLLTGDEKYARKFWELLHDWTTHNRDYHGINYCSALESAFRIHSLIWGLCFFGNSTSLNDEYARDVYHVIFVAATFIEDHLSRYFAPNTHLLGEAYALFVVGLLFPEFARAPHWREVGYEALTAEVENQFTADGMHAELSTAYHAYAAEFMLSTIVLSAASHFPLAEQYRSRLRQITSVLTMLQKPDGRWPHIGDEDGGRLFFLSRPRAGDFRPLLEVCQSLFSEEDSSSTAPHYIDSFWLVGLPANQQAVTHVQSRIAGHLKSSGITVSRSESGMYSSMQCGRFGYLDSPHSHADMLHLDLAIGEDSFVIDPGTYAYTGDAATRNRYRSVSQHNGPAIDGFEFLNPADPFGWLHKPDCTVDVFAKTNRSDFYQASYRLAMKGAGAVAVSRFVLFIHDQMWVIGDEVQISKAAQVSWRFVTPQVVSMTPGLATLRGKSTNLAIVPCFAKTANPRIDLENCPISDDYLSTVNGAAVHVTTQEVEQVAALFALLPFHRDAELPTSWKLDSVNGCSCATIAVGEHRHRILFGGDGMHTIGDVTTDATSAYVRSHGDQIERVIMVNGSHLTIGSRVILETRSVASYIDLSYETGQATVEHAAGVELVTPRADSVRVTVTGREA